MATTRVTQSQTAHNPTINFLASAKAYFKSDMGFFSLMEEAFKQPRDEHGNIWIGIDDKNFNLWRGKLEHIVPQKYFGPILIPTNLDVIHALLKELKGGKEAEFIGNRSTDVAASLIGTENTFAAKDKKTHDEHKKAFMGFINDNDSNLQIVSPIIKGWVKEHLGKNTIEGADTTELVAKILLAFLLRPQAANNETLVKAIASVKGYFIDKATKPISWFEYLISFFPFAKKQLEAEIIKLSKEDSSNYPKYLMGQLHGEDLENAVAQHVISTMMVGFDNLQSALISTLVNYAHFPKYKTELKKELQKVDGVDVIRVNPVYPKSFGQQYFEETLRDMPPVWLQARKNGKHTRVIAYGDDAKSFLMPSGTFVLIPNFQLMHDIPFEYDFEPGRDLKDTPIPYPFSMGPNACPGRKIAYAATGCLLAELVKENISATILQEPRLDPKVALKYKNFTIALEKKPLGHLATFFALAPEKNVFDEPKKTVQPRR